MAAYLEVWRPAGAEVVPLVQDEVTLGKDDRNSVRLEFDASVSRLHAVLVRYPSGWTLRDVGSRNGTFVNGSRVAGEHVLRSGDEIRLGAVRLVFRADRAEQTATDATFDLPELTRREREVLLALCRPILGGEMFTEPATRREIARELGVSEDAIKQHLARLFDKFDIHEPERRRVRLANEAIRRAAVTVRDLDRPSGPRL